jgi:hypothetical protein
MGIAGQMNFVHRIAACPAPSTVKELFIFIFYCHRIQSWLAMEMVRYAESCDRKNEIKFL